MINLSIPVAGMQAASERMQVSSQKIATAGTNRENTPDNNLAGNIIDMKAAETAFKANAKSFSIASDTLGSILDMKV